MRLILTLLLVVFLSLPAHADQLADGKAAYLRGDWPNALKLLQPLAEQGNAEAQSELGWMYKRGSGVKMDLQEALRWFRKAADQGNAKDEYDLGATLIESVRISKGAKTDAQAHDEAIKWFRKAAEQGIWQAELSLGEMYGQADGVKQDYAEAYFWNTLAAWSCPSGLLPRGDVIMQTKDYLKHLTPEQKTALDKRVADWLKLHPVNPVPEAVPLKL